jgi:hypothetical protein
VVLTTNSEVYGKQYGDGNMYLCRYCGASVGCHPNTVIPLGRMADDELKKLKKLAHSYFDPIWQNKKRQRRECYQVLARKMGISVDDCHFGWFDAWQLYKALDILRKGLFPKVEEQPYTNYEGRKIHCITNKCYNFTLDKLYIIKARAVFPDGRPTDFYVTDDEGINRRMEWFFKREQQFIII